MSATCKCGLGIAPFRSGALRRKRNLTVTAAVKETWTNVDGQTLKEVRPSVWMAERPFVWNSIDVGGRMAVVKLKDGSLFVHSPVELDEDLKFELAKLGPVKHVLSPNYEHVKFAQQWIDAYPDARSWACPGMIEKEPSISFGAEVGVNNETPDTWPDEILVTHMDFEVNPFTGNPFFNEVVCCHVPSKTLYTTDFFWNYPGSVPGGTKAWKFGMDVVYRPFYFDLMIKNKDGYKQAMDRLFSQPWDCIVPCHGTIVSENAKDTLRKFIG